MSYKVGSRIGRLGSVGPLLNNFIAKASSELISGDRVSLVKSKVFARLTRQIKEESLYGTIAVAAGHIAMNQGHTSGSLRANDAFYLNNFKGIRNIGYRFDPEAKKKGLGGEILGFDRFA